jgi:hypothetical protein
MKLVLDLKQMTRALNEYKEATGKDGATVLNRAGRNVAYRAAQFTPVATPARIRADLNSDPHLKYALTSLYLKKKGRGILKSPQFQYEVDKFVARRVASRAFLRSGWAEAIIHLGGTYRGRRVGKGHGWAHTATASALATEIANTVPGIEEMGTVALQGAINFVAEDMLGWAHSILARTAKQHGY